MVTSDPHPHEQHGGTISHEQTKNRVLLLYISIGINIIIVGSQIAFGIIADSLGLLADAGHNFADVAGLILALYALKATRRSSTKSRTFGFHRTGVLAAQANAALILIVTGFITVEGIQRLIDPEPVKGGIVVVVALCAAIGNLGAALLLRRSSVNNGTHTHDLNMRAATLHLFSDAAASIAVLFAGLVIAITGEFYWLDPLMSLGIGVVIAVQAFTLLKNSNDVLLESTPRDIDISEVESTILGVAKVSSLHDLHVWSLSMDMRALSAHVVIEGNPTLRETHNVSEEIRELLASNFHITHSTIECETENV